MTERHENELARLDVFIGKWINKGVTVPPDGAAPDEILTSDVYERRPGGRFVLHTAYGRVGDRHVGGTKIIGYDQQGAGVARPARLCIQQRWRPAYGRADGWLSRG